jgi:hypothetical protein
MITTTPWFDPAALMWIGPTGGVAEGLWGAGLGLLSYALIRKGRARGWVLGYVQLGLLASIALLAAGAAGAATGQPQIIWISLLILGAPLLAVSIPTLFNVANLYRHAELRRMSALEQ